MKLRVLSDVVVAFAGLSEVAEDVVNPAGPRSAHPGTIVGDMPINEVAEDVVNPAGPRSAHPGSIIMPTNLSVLGDLAEDVVMTSESSLCDSDMSIQPSQLIEPPKLKPQG